jgi:hypothetical protein
VIWLLTRPPSFAGGGIGKSLAEAAKMTFAEIENLLRSCDERGNPVNEEVSMARARASAKRAVETRVNMQGKIDELEKRHG